MTLFQEVELYHTFEFNGELWLKVERGRGYSLEGMYTWVFSGEEKVKSAVVNSVDYQLCEY